MAAQHGENKQQAERDPLAHERGLNPKLPHNEDPIGELRNEGLGNDQGWHQGGDWGGGHASNVGESAGEVADDEAELSEAASTAAGSQTTDKNQAPGSNTSSTSTGVVSTESERQTKR